jgi:hypothetical protein
LRSGSAIFSGKAQREPADLVVLALTPGIPFEWIVHVGRLNSVYKSELKRLVNDATPEQIALAHENASSITEDDAWAMLAIIPDDYRGAIPLYAQLWLQQTAETDAVIAKRLNKGRTRILRWRSTNNFDPLTGVRLS